MIRSKPVVLVGALALGVVLGCRVQRDNPAHCFHARGDATCLERYPDGSLPFCIADSCGEDPFGCVAELPEPTCYSPCGDEALLGEGECELADDESETGSESGSESDTTDAGPDLPPGPECELDSDCLDREGTRFCIDGSCEPCTSMPDPGLACATRDPDLPVCHEDECVVCYGEDQAACSAQEQICIADTTSCGPCTDHDQCAGGAACNILDGVCFPEDAVWHIDGDGSRNFVGIEEATNTVGTDEAATFILHELDGAALYEERVYMGGPNQSIALLAAPGEHPRVSNTQFNTPTVVLFDGSLLYLRGVQVRGNEGIILVGQTRAYVENSEFYVSSGPGIEVGEDSYVVMRNSMVRGGGVDLRLLVARDQGSYDIVNSTLVSFGEVLSCPTFPTYGSVRNSVLANSSGDLSTCAATSVDLHGNALTSAIPTEPDNTVIGVPQADWFVDGAYDLHFTSQVPLAVTTAATWKEGDPLTDFDGDPRPVGPGVTDWAGADVPSP